MSSEGQSDSQTNADWTTVTLYTSLLCNFCQQLQEPSQDTSLPLADVLFLTVTCP